MQSHILGFPRIGAARELKKALERYWKDPTKRSDLLTTAAILKERHWALQKAAGLSFVSVGDFSLYDHVLDTSLMFNIIPERLLADKGIAKNADPHEEALELYFNIARGDSKRNIHASEMTKWFNTNYHYIVPEFSAKTKPALTSRKIIDETHEAIALGYQPKPVLLGPITYLSLAKGTDGFDPWCCFEEMIALYKTVIHELSAVCPWIQIDEPILCTQLSQMQQDNFRRAYQILNSDHKGKLLLTTYFDTVDDHLELALQSGCQGLHIDEVLGAHDLQALIDQMPSTMILSLGLVNGRNIWKTNLRSAYARMEAIKRKNPHKTLWIGSSCSLLHAPVDLALEDKLDPTIKHWLAFATQKCKEITLLRDVHLNIKSEVHFYENDEAIKSRLNHPAVINARVRARCAAVTPQDFTRQNPFPQRKWAQQWLDLPLFPTTTIGSFPQTTAIRKMRLEFKKGMISDDQYQHFLKEEIAQVVKIQENLGLDVFVHGEPERNDMVEYFGAQLEGFCFTEHAWVQSYGSRCVKPPVIFGDISRPKAMTVAWSQYAQSLTQKPMKGMLTGPVTILCWSFVRDDLPRSTVCQQIALAIRDEVIDLEKTGMGIIQIDEAALSEGLPIKPRDAKTYLRWAINAFRLAASGVSDRTQIHTHMCYSAFNEIMPWIGEMDADVISIESSRSKMTLLDAFKHFNYPNDIGPGIYDIHSPRIPTSKEIFDLLTKALSFIDRERLWVNPDCGLKTRDWPETLNALENMVTATKHLRQKYSKIS